MLFGTSKALGHEDATVRVDGVGEVWSVATTSDGNEQTHTLQTDCYKVAITNLSSYDGAALSGDARIAITSAQTVDAGDYFPLASGAELIVYVGDKAAIYYKRETSTDVTLSIRELLI